MIAPIDLSTLPALAQRVLDPSAPSKLKQGAAKGLLPGLKPVDLVAVVALLTQAQDPEIASTAVSTLTALPKPVLEGALATGALPPAVLDTLAHHYRGADPVLQLLLDHSNLPLETVLFLAERGSELVCERIATNEQRLLEQPEIIERLYMNRATRMSTADRVLELAVRNGIELAIPAFREAAAAIRDELISEPSAEPTPDDILFSQTEALARVIQVNPEVEDTHELDDSGQEQVRDKCRPLWVQLAQMTVTQKIRRALLGTATERMMLVRDTNRLVASAAIRSPMMRESEVAVISSSRAVSEEVLRIVATNRDWIRHHQIKFNLVTNPRTPFTFASALVPHLREHELRTIAKSKNVPGAIALAARQHLLRKGKTG